MFITYSLIGSFRSGAHALTITLSNGNNKEWSTEISSVQCYLQYKDLQTHTYMKLKSETKCIIEPQ